MATCGEVMTPNPACCLGSDSVQKAAQIMKDEEVGPVPVVEDQDAKRLVGIVTDRDLALGVVAEGKDPMTTTVDTVMRRVLATCTAEDDTDYAAKLMEEHQVRRIPVVDADGAIVGIIAQADLATRLDEPGKVAEVVERVSE